MHVHTAPPPRNKRLERNPNNANHVTLFQPLPLSPRVLLFPRPLPQPRRVVKLISCKTVDALHTTDLDYAGAERQRCVFLSKVTEEEGVEQSAGANARIYFYGAGCISSVDS